MQESEFYQRQSILKEIGLEGQQKLRDLKVLVVGAGGLGHPASTYLAAAGIGQITIIDNDKIEASNLNRQIFFNASEVGLSKSKVLAKKIALQNPFIQVNHLEEKITSENIDQLASSFNCIIDCTDNFPTKFLLHDYCWFQAIDLVQASIYQYEGQLQSFRYSKEKTKGCLRCLWPKTPSQGCVGNCQESGVIGAVAGTLGTMQAMEVINGALELNDSSQMATKTFNLINMSIQNIKWQKDLTCPLCSNSPSIKSIEDQHYNPRADFEIIELDQEAIFVDIRETHEIHEENTPSFQKMISRPLSEFEKWKDEINGQDKYIFFCTKGIRSSNLVERLLKDNKVNCYSLFQGLDRLDSLSMS